MARDDEPSLLHETAMGIDEVTMGIHETAMGIDEVTMGIHETAMARDDEPSLLHETAMGFHHTLTARDDPSPRTDTTHRNCWAQRQAGCARSAASYSAAFGGGPSWMRSPR
jgi:hypothetical protein